jgi:hypothetical protein
MADGFFKYTFIASNIYIKRLPPPNVGRSFALQNNGRYALHPLCIISKRRPPSAIQHAISTPAISYYRFMEGQLGCAIRIR